MKIAKRIAAGLLLLVAVVIGVPFAVGSRMDRDHVASGETLVRAPIGEVWATVTDFERMPEWWSERARITRVSAAGEPARFEEVAPDFRVTYDFREVEAPRRLVVDMKDDAGYFGGTWTYELEPADGGTRVKITEAGWAGPGFFRFMLWLFGADATLRDCLAALSKKHGG